MALKPKEVLDRVYSELIDLGKPVRDFEGQFIWVEDSDMHRTDTCYFDYKGDIVETGEGEGFFVLRGKPGGRQWMTSMTDGISYGKLVVNNPKYISSQQEDVDDLVERMEKCKSKTLKALSGLHMGLLTSIVEDVASSCSSNPNDGESFQNLAPYEETLEAMMGELKTFAWASRVLPRWQEEIEATKLSFQGWDSLDSGYLRWCVAKRTGTVSHSEGDFRFRGGGGGYFEPDKVLKNLESYLSEDKLYSEHVAMKGRIRISLDEKQTPEEIRRKGMTPIVTQSLFKDKIVKAIVKAVKKDLKL